MKAIRVLVSYALACLAVGFVWGGGAAWSSTRHVSLTSFVTQWWVISYMVVLVAALPAWGFYTVLARRGAISYVSAALVGFVIGSTCFVVFFSSWVSGSFLKGLAELIFYGGGLGMIGGLVYIASERMMTRGAVRI